MVLEERGRERGREGGREEEEGEKKGKRKGKEKRREEGRRGEGKGRVKRGKRKGGRRGKARGGEEWKRKEKKGKEGNSFQYSELLLHFRNSHRLRAAAFEHFISLMPVLVFLSSNHFRFYQAHRRRNPLALQFIRTAPSPTHTPAPLHSSGPFQFLDHARHPTPGDRGAKWGEKGTLQSAPGKHPSPAPVPLKTTSPGMLTLGERESPWIQRPFTYVGFIEDFWEQWE